MEYPCTCSVTSSTGGFTTINYCNLHAHAAEYKAALQEIRDSGCKCLILHDDGCHVLIASRSLEHQQR